MLLNTKTGKLSQFNFLRILGKGTFGKVFLVENKQISSQKMALKAMNKSFLVRYRYVAKANQEKVVLSKICHDNIIKFIDSFQSPKFIFLLFEYFESLDLWTLQHTIKKAYRYKCTIYETKIIGAQICKALYYLHDQRIIFRDLKPENAVVSRTGLTKIIDFGFSKMLDATGRTGTFCGTPEYIAPEIISQQLYTYAVDWWSFGILLYELLNGFTPFSSDAQESSRSYDAMAQFGIIISSEVPYFSYIDDDSKKLLDQLLQKDPTRRLGHIYGGAQRIIKHPWFDVITPSESNNVNLNFEFHERIYKFNDDVESLESTHSRSLDFAEYFQEYSVC